MKLIPHPEADGGFFMEIIKGIYDDFYVFWVNNRVLYICFPFFTDFIEGLGNNLGIKCFFAQFQSSYDDY